MNQLDPSKLHSAWIEFTSNCDKQCVYCFSMQKGYLRANLPETILEDIRKYLIAKAPDTVYVSGHGETTIYPGWHKICSRWIDCGLPLHIISHLGREFKEEEIEVLSRFREVTTSVDSHLEKEHDRLRRGAPLALILKNMERIRAFARSSGCKPPEFAWDCVVCDWNIWSIFDYLDFGIRHGVSRFVFCNLVKYPEMKEDIFHISELPLSDLPKVLTLLENAMTFLREKQIVFHMDAGLMDAVKMRLSKDACLEGHSCHPSQEQGGSGNTDSWNGRIVFSGAQAPGTTRFCVEPWTMLFVQASGDVQPCLFSRQSIGSLKSASLEEICHGDAIKRYREGLVSGNLMEECRQCNQKSWVSIANFLRYRGEWM